MPLIFTPRLTIRTNFHFWHWISVSWNLWKVPPDNRIESMENMKKIKSNTKYCVECEEECNELNQRISASLSLHIQNQSWNLRNLRNLGGIPTEVFPPFQPSIPGRTVEPENLRLVVIGCVPVVTQRILGGMKRMPMFHGWIPWRWLGFVPENMKWMGWLTCTFGWIMNPGDLITEYSIIEDTFPNYNNLGIILERTGIFPNWLYKVLSQDSSIKIYRSGSIKRLQIFHENWWSNKNNMDHPTRCHNNWWYKNCNLLESKSNKTS